MFNTRIAPSPTGPVHLGTMRTAYFNWLAARASGGKFIVRIDDTDQERSEDQYVNQFFEALEFLGLDWDDTFQQSRRTKMYNLVADQLVEAGHAKGCPLRFNFKLEDESWYDEIVGDVKITKEDQDYIQGMTLKRLNGTATYPFANVVDDRDCGINWVIRGQDHISNTSRQIALHRALGWQLPKYSHVGLIAENGKKMSKRSGDFMFDQYKKFHPDAVLNCMLRLGWSPTKDDKSTKLIDRDRAVQMFLTEGKMRPKMANFDIVKLQSFDRKYRAK